MNFRNKEDNDQEKETIIIDHRSHTETVTVKPIPPGRKEIKKYNKKTQETIKFKT
jgi:hypothetical protein